MQLVEKERKKMKYSIYKNNTVLTVSTVKSLCIRNLNRATTVYQPCITVYNRVLKQQQYYN